MERLEKGGITGLQWLLTLLKASFDIGVVYGLAWCMYSAPVQKEG